MEEFSSTRPSRSSPCAAAAVEESELFDAKPLGEKSLATLIATISEFDVGTENVLRIVPEYEIFDDGSWRIFSSGRIEAGGGDSGDNSGDDSGDGGVSMIDAAALNVRLNSNDEEDDGVS